MATSNSSSLSPRTQSPTQHRKPAKKTPAKMASVQSPAEDHPFSRNSSEANVALAMVAHMLDSADEDYVDTITDLGVAPYFALLVKEHFGISLEDFKRANDFAKAEGADQQLKNRCLSILDFGAHCYEAGRLDSKIRALHQEIERYPAINPQLNGN